MAKWQKPSYWAPASHFASHFLTGLPTHPWSLIPRILVFPLSTYQNSSMASWLNHIAKACLICLPLWLTGCTDPCNHIACQNGGVCTDGTCDCPSEWTGQFCETISCELRECQNGGVCLWGGCVCPPGYIGAECESRITDNLIGEWEGRQRYGHWDEEEYIYFTANLTSDAPQELWIQRMGIDSVPFFAYIDRPDSLTFFYQNWGETTIRYGAGKLITSDSLLLDILVGINSLNCVKGCEILLTR